MVCRKGRSGKRDDKMRETEDCKYHIHGGNRREIHYDFSVNINPLGMPKGCLEAANRALLQADRYPDIFHDELIEVLSARNGGHHLLLGNGSCELIYSLCHYIGHKYPGYEAFTIAPSFSEYGFAIAASGGKNRIFITREEDDYSPDKRWEELKEKICGSAVSGEPVKLLFICNPNNPTGELIKRDRLEKMADALESHGVLLLVDECFLRFDKRYAQVTMTEVLSAHGNVIVLDAFTKFYAMPGLRLGYALSSDKDLLDGIREGMQPWNVSDSACAAAVRALKDRGYEDRTVDYIKKQRTYLADELEKVDLRVIGNPAGPFIMFEGPGGLREALNSLGFDIRDCSDMLSMYDPDRHCYRIGVGKEEDNRLLIDGIKSLMGK
ncbi:MAG TPA: hypothetical protein DIS78_06990 [Lachnospiraceae bacterium]|nr:hypothetical protein [Lachnospiraceae bacterium]